MLLNHCKHQHVIYNRFIKDYVSVPCRHCISCKYVAGSDLVNRARYEELNYKHSLFITLTYDNCHLPKMCPQDYFEEIFDFYTDELLVSPSEASKIVSKICCKPYIGYLSRYDVQCFLKRFRINFERFFDETLDFKYIIVGEYGTRKYRPHYHAVFFFNDSRFLTNHHQLLSKAWQNGYVYSVFPKGGCVEYCTKYITFDCHLPAIYKWEPFKAFKITSHKSAVGVLQSSGENFRKFFFDGVSEFDFPGKKDFKSIKVPTQNETYYFPIFAYSRNLSSGLRNKYYKIYETLSGIGYTKKDFVNLFCESEQSLAESLWYKSKRIYNVISQFDLSYKVYDYFYDQYYYKRDITKLNDYFRFIQDFELDRRYLLSLYHSQFGSWCSHFLKWSYWPFDSYELLVSLGYKPPYHYNRFSDKSIKLWNDFLYDVESFSPNNCPSQIEYFDNMKSFYKHDYSLRDLNSVYINSLS